MFRWLVLVLVLAAVIAGLVVGVLNPDSVTVDLVIARLSFPLGALMLMAVGAGVLLGLVLAWVMFVIPGRISRRRVVAPKSGSRGLARSGDD